MRTLGLCRKTFSLRIAAHDMMPFSRSGWPYPKGRYAVVRDLVDNFERFATRARTCGAVLANDCGRAAHDMGLSKLTRDPSRTCRLLISSDCGRSQGDTLDVHY